MSHCEYCTSCFFFIEIAEEMPNTVDYLKEQYCNGAFSNCARFRIIKSYGSHNVPTYIYPNDSCESLNLV